jgi:dTDP-glucose pyrophosphorylase
MSNYKRHLIISGSLIKHALVQLDELSTDAILFVIDNNQKLIGSLTDGDIRRGLIKGISIENKVDDIIQENPRVIRKGDTDIDKVIEFRDNHYRIIPIVDLEDKVINVINFREFKSYLPVDVVIMAGGKGQRLLPLTESTPKPLLFVGDKPIIEHNIDRLALYGIDNFWISINYLGDQLKSYFEDGSSKNINIKYVKEDIPLGTIGAVSLISDFKHDFVLITNSDILTNIDYEHFFLDFINQNADMAIVTIPYNVNIPYAVLDTDDGQVLSFKEKPTFTYYSNGGIYLVKRQLLEHLPINEFYNATDLISKLINLKMKVYSYPLTEYWLDIGNHDDFKKAQKDVKNLNFL